MASMWLCGFWVGKPQKCGVETINRETPVATEGKAANQILADQQLLQSRSNKFEAGFFRFTIIFNVGSSN